VEIVKQLTHMLDEHNVHAKSFKMTRDHYREQKFDNFKLQRFADRSKDGRIYNIPNVSEVATLIVGVLYCFSNGYYNGKQKWKFANN